MPQYMINCGECIQTIDSLCIDHTLICKGDYLAFHFRHQSTAFNIHNPRDFSLDLIVRDLETSRQIWTFYEIIFVKRSLMVRWCLVVFSILSPIVKYLLLLIFLMTIEDKCCNYQKLYNLNNFEFLRIRHSKETLYMYCGLKRI